MSEMCDTHKNRSVLYLWPVILVSLLASYSWLERVWNEWVKRGSKINNEKMHWKGKEDRWHRLIVKELQSLMWINVVNNTEEKSTIEKFGGKNVGGKHRPPKSTFSPAHIPFKYLKALRKRQVAEVGNISLKVFWKEVKHVRILFRGNRS